MIHILDLKLFSTEAFVEPTHHTFDISGHMSNRLSSKYWLQRKSRYFHNFKNNLVSFHAGSLVDRFFYSCLSTTVLFFFKFVSQANNSKTYRPNESPRKQKILSFFKFVEKKVSRVNKRNFLHLLNESIHRFCHMIFANFFLQKFEKLQNVIFGLMNVETASHQDTQGLSCSKVARFEGGFIPKTFQVLQFLFLVDIFLSYLPVKQI